MNKTTAINLPTKTIMSPRIVFEISSYLNSLLQFRILPKIIICVSALALFGTGCGEEEAAPAARAIVTNPTKASVKGKKKSKKNALKAASEITKKRQWAYSPVGKRDPFRSYIADMKMALLEGSNKQVSETRRYDLEQYKLTGVISGTSQPKVMLQDPTGKGHILTIGDHIGKQGGIVKRISNRGMVVVQEFRDPASNKLVRVPITILLPQEQIDLQGR